MLTFKALVYILLVGASRYGINRARICAIIMASAVFASRIFGDTMLTAVLMGLLAFGFYWWNFDLLRQYQRWSMHWLAIAGLGILVLYLGF